MNRTQALSSGGIGVAAVVAIGVGLCSGGVASSHPEPYSAKHEALGVRSRPGECVQGMTSTIGRPRADAPRSPEGALARVNLSALTLLPHAASAKVAVAERYEDSRKVAAARVDAFNAKDRLGRTITVWYVTEQEVSASCAAPDDDVADSPQPGITPGAPRPSDWQPPPGPVPTQTE